MPLKLKELCSDWSTDVHMHLHKSPKLKKKSPEFLMLYLSVLNLKNKKVLLTKTTSLETLEESKFI